MIRECGRDQNEVVPRPGSLKRVRSELSGARPQSTKFWRNEDGVTAIEFAIVGPIFFGLMLAILQYSYIFITETVIDNAVFVSVREARLGELQRGQPEPDLQAGALRQRICELSAVLIRDCNGDPDFTVDMLTYPNFGAIDVSDEMNAGGTPGAGGPNDIVMVRARYDLPLFGFMGIGFDDIGELTLRSFAIYRNEPFIL